MGKILAHLKNVWPWILGLLGSFVVWLKYIHDPAVANEARKRLKLRELDRRRKRLEEVEAKTWKSEAKLLKKKRELNEKLDRGLPSRDAGDAAERMAERFGWTGEGGGG